MVDKAMNDRGAAIASQGNKERHGPIESKPIQHESIVIHPMRYTSRATAGYLVSRNGFILW